MPLRITTPEGAHTVEVLPGAFLTELAADAGLVLNTRCGGRGTCRGCKVHLEAGAFLVDGETRHVAPGDPPLLVRACQTQPLDGEGTIRFPASSVVEKRAQIEDDFVLEGFPLDPPSLKFALSLPAAAQGHPGSAWQRVLDALPSPTIRNRIEAPLSLLQRVPDLLRSGEGRVTVTLGRASGDRWVAIDLEAGDASSAHYGVAVDIGTTTVVALLTDLNTGNILGKASMYNQQLGRADDVASRISYATSPDRLHEMQRLVAKETLNPLIHVLCERAGIRPHSIVRLAVAGNTVMTHLFLGLSPEGIGKLPFEPVIRDPQPCRAEAVHLDIHPRAWVDAVPSVAGYIGGDITADLLVAHFLDRRETVLLVDIGTNGEMVLSHQGRLYACATAAGPAFEGAGLGCGCRAAAGAIERVRMDPAISFEVIGGGPPRGICGSGIVDFIAEGMRTGLINRFGRFDVEALKAAGRYADVSETDRPVHACLLAPAEASGNGGPVYVSEYDLSQVLKAKAAIYAGMLTLVERAGCRFAELERIYLAGGFARHLSLANAMHMGLLPVLPEDRYLCMGNGSLAGAYLAITCRDAREAFAEIINRPEVVELNLEPNFESHFVDALALPNLNLE